MSPTTPSSRTRATGWMLRIAAVAALLVAGVGVAPAAHADPTPTPTAASGSATLTLAPAGDGVLRTGDDLTLWTEIHNASSTSWAAGTATVQLGSTPLADRAALGAWLAGQDDAALTAPAQVGSVSLPAVAPGADAPAGTVVAATDPALAGRAPGIYPVAATADSPSGSLTARSVVVIPREGAAAPVGVVVPVTAGHRGAALLTSNELAELTAPDGTLTGILDAVAGTPAILAVDPAVVAAIRVLGSSAPETATAWLGRLLALPNQRFALQFGDADTAVQLQAGAAAPRQPTSLSSLMSAADFRTTTATPAPTPTATPGGAALPDLAALTDVGAARADVYWPVSGTAGADVVATLGADADAVTLVPSATTAAGAGGAHVAARAQAGAAALLVYDSAVSDALRAAATSPAATPRGAALATASAYLALATASGEPTLVAVDRADQLTRVGLGAAIAAVVTAPGARAATLDELLAAAPVEATVADIAPDADRVAAASALFADEDRLTRFSTVLADPSVLLGPERAEVLQLLGAGWVSHADAAAFADAVSQHRATTGAQQSAVGVLSPSPFNLLGQSLAYWVHNDLPWPVDVVLYATPDDLRLEVDSGISVHVDPSSNKRVVVPVRERVGNGDVTVALQLRSASGVPIGDAQYAAVNVRADWEGWGLVVLVGVVVALLAVGLVRTILRRRRGAADAGASS